LQQSEDLSTDSKVPLLKRWGIWPFVSRLNTFSENGSFYGQFAISAMIILASQVLDMPVFWLLTFLQVTSTHLSDQNTGMTSKLLIQNDISCIFSNDLRELRNHAIDSYRDLVGHSKRFGLRVERQTLIVHFG
jgi:hypothetical protein